MKDRWKLNPLFRLFAVYLLLVVLFITAGIGLFYFLFSIPEPEGLSLASWPSTFTDNFSVWMENDKGTLQIEEIGLKRLDEYGLWLQVIDESGQEVFSHNKPEDFPTSYTASELMSFSTSTYADGNTIFVSSFEKAGRTWNYLIGFPYDVGKYILYYNGEAVSRLRSVFTSSTFTPSVFAPFVLVVFFAGMALFLIYGVWLTRQTGKIVKGIGNISRRDYKTLPEKGIFGSIYMALNKMDEEIRHSDQIKEETDRVRREWITNITHDLKTPLSPVKGYAELLADGTDVDAKAAQEYGTIILKNVDYAEKLMNDLKLTYQLESGAFPFHPQQVRLVRYLKELVIDIANDPTFSNRDIEFESESNLSELTVAIDPDLFRRAVGNLVVNALVHNPPDTKVIVSVSEDKQKGICITVRDNGVGIKEAEQAELFTRYYRGTNTKEKPEGSGLGLAIAKQIVVLHGGDIAVKSKSGEGTEFSILLPAN